MTALMSDYAPILIFLALAIGLGLVLIVAALVVAVNNPRSRKAVGL